RVVRDLMGKVVDGVEVLLIASADELLEYPAGVAAGLVEVAGRVAPQSSYYRPDPLEQVLGRGVVPAHRVVERVHVVDELGREVDLVDQGLTAVLVFRRFEGVLQL